VRWQHSFLWAVWVTAGALRSSCLQKLVTLMSTEQPAMVDKVNDVQKASQPLVIVASPSIDVPVVAISSGVTGFVGPALPIFC
jgi:hypothetical protein